eukprot:7737244-Alexandrium_andersonii.AAC.1
MARLCGRLDSAHGSCVGRRVVHRCRVRDAYRGCVIQSSSEHVGGAGEPGFQSEGHRFGGSEGFSSAARSAEHAVRACAAAVFRVPSGGCRCDQRGATATVWAS